MFNRRNIKFLIIQIFAIILYLEFMVPTKQVIKDGIYKAVFDPISFLVQVAIMMAISVTVGHFMAKKPPAAQHAKPSGLEQFNIPTAEEGRPIQVLFGKRYISGPNVVWYGDLKTQEIWSDGREGNLV